MKLFKNLSPAMQAVAAHLLLVAFAGLFVMGALLTEPSQSGGFLGYSTGRWAVLFVNILALAGILFALYRVWTKQAEGLETWLSSEQHLSRHLISTLLLFGVVFPAGMGWIPFIRYFPYFGRIQPSLLWLALGSGSVALNLSIVLRKAVLLWFSQFFPFETTVPEVPNLTKTQRNSLLGISLVYVLLQIASILQVREANWLPDSIDYIFPAETYAWNELGLWAHTKPWGAAVLYKIVGSSPVTIDAVQTVLSAFAWLALAWIFSKTIRKGWTRVTAFGFVLGFSLAPSVQMWNHVIQSEALSISLMVLILAVWFSLLQRWRWEKFIALIFLFGWWIGTRETNVYLGLMTAGILLLVGLLYKRQRFYWAMCVVLFLFCNVNMQISELPTLPRWLYPLTNTLLNRIVPNEEYLSYFEGHGLPVSPELLSLSGGMAKSGDFAIYNDPSLNEVESWLYRKGKDVYIQFLISHPGYTLTEPWKNIHLLLEPKELSEYTSESYTPILGKLFGTLLYPDSLWLVLLLILITVVMAIKTRSWKNAPAFWLILGTLALFIPHFYIVWHGDAAEVGRHAIQASVQLRLSLWLLLLVGFDKVFVRQDL